MRAFYNDVAQLQVSLHHSAQINQWHSFHIILYMFSCRISLSLSLSTTQPKSISDIYTILFSICFLAGCAQKVPPLQSRYGARAGCSLICFKLPFPFLKIITLQCSSRRMLISSLVTSASSRRKLQKASPHRCLYLIQHMMFGRCRYSYPF